MKLSFYHVVLAIVLAMVAGCLGALAAGQWSAHESDNRGLHSFIHEQLDLTAPQAEKLDQLEADFTTKRQRLEADLRTANAQLAQAMREEHTYGPKVSAAIDRVHAHMGELQKATVRHVFAMRALLDEKQREKFDRQVSASLTGNPRE